MALVALVVGYLLGSIPGTWLIGRWQGVDLRRVGTGNVGAANLAGSTGRSVAAIGLFLDAAKGVGAALLGERWGAAAGVLGGLGAIVGHGWPLWLRFAGGRSQAVALAAGAVLAPWATLALLPILGVGFVMRRLAASWLPAVAVWPVAAAVIGEWQGVLYAVGAGVLTIALRLVGGRRGGGQPWRQVWRSRLLYDRDP